MRRRRRVFPPVPPAEMLPARTLRVPGRGEFFLRDSGESPGGDSPRGKTVMLLHGWMVSADLNWWAAYADLVAAGYRVLAIDHRGHGRGLRAMEPFRIRDVAADAAEVLRQLGVGPALVAGYSMGGAIAQQLAHDHPDVVRGVVLSGTAQHWKDPETQRAFKALGLLGFSLSLAPRFTYGLAFRRVGVLREAPGAWVRAELMRNEARDIAEAGRELGRFDSRPWLAQVRAPIAVVLTTRDELVPPRKQRELAEAARARVFEVPLTHLELSWRGEAYNPALLAALEAVSGGEPAAAVAEPPRAAVDRVA